MSELKEIFEELPLPQSSKPNSFSAKTIEGFENHRIGKNKDNNPCLLIFIPDNSKDFIVQNQCLFNIRVSHNLRCEIESNKVISQNNFSVISYIGQSDDVRDLFLTTCQVLIESLGNNPSNKQVTLTVEKFIELFKAVKEVPKTSIQGLWCELFLIDQSNTPEVLIKGWHSIPEEKFDFSLSRLRLEVKSTIKESREHHFSLGQLFSTNDIEIIIASFQVTTNVSGYSVKDLINKIDRRLSAFPKQKEKLHLISYSTLGIEIERTDEVKFDYDFAKDRLSFFESSQIPKINEKVIPQEVTNVNFVSNLINAKNLDYNVDELVAKYFDK